MMVLPGDAQASIGGLMNEAGIDRVEQLLVLAAQELAAAKYRVRTGGAVLLQSASTTIREPSA